MNIDIKKQTKEWKQRFSLMGDTELVETYEKQRKNPGWVSIKALYMYLLRIEMTKRNIQIKGHIHLNK